MRIAYFIVTCRLAYLCFLCNRKKDNAHVAIQPKLEAVCGNWGNSHTDGWPSPDIVDNLGADLAMQEERVVFVPFVHVRTCMLAISACTCERFRISLVVFIPTG